MKKDRVIVVVSQPLLVHCHLQPTHISVAEQVPQHSDSSVSIWPIPPWFDRMAQDLLNIWLDILLQQSGNYLARVCSTVSLRSKDKISINQRINAVRKDYEAQIVLPDWL